jgi:Bacteriophage tail sheath protein
MSYSYPGVYIQELPSPVHAITGVATSIAAFVGYTPRGIDNRAQVLFSFADFTRLYGGLGSDSEVSYAVQQFYQNAPGAQAYVVRVPRTGAKGASVTFDKAGKLVFTALSSGTWANGQLLIDVDTGPPVNLTADPLAFNLTVTSLLDRTTESFPNLTLAPNAMNFVATVVNDPDNGSQLVRVDASGLPSSPAALTVSGVVGQAIAVNTLNTTVGTGTPVVANGDWGLLIDTSSPTAGTVPGLPVVVKVFGQGTPIPQSMSGLAGQLQQAMNAALSLAVRGASVQCSVVPVTGGQALRINASLPNQPDAVLALGAPTGTGAPQDVLSALALAGPAYNVAHYALGTNNSGAGYGNQFASARGVDGTGLPGTGDLIGDPATFKGIYALQKVDLFNLLSIPDATRAQPVNSATLDANVNSTAVYSAAIALCDQRRAFLLVDPPPNVTTIAGALDWMTGSLGITDPNGAAFFPRLRLPDQANNYNLRTFAPSGVVAGVYATTDGTRGVWKAPAGIGASLSGVQGMTYLMSDQENGLLNPAGLNCLRTFPVYGPVLWGARTLQGADAETSQWKYVPVRRMALFLEESLYRGTKWVVFEPNDAPLWAAIRLNIGSFMQTLFLKQAFQGATPDVAYFVKCDSETTTQADIDNGIVNILVGFAPLKPAEFVVIQIEQLTGQ